MNSAAGLDITQTHAEESSQSGRAPAGLSIGSKLKILAGDIKIAHTVFALPFALLATFLAADAQPRHLPYAGQIFLILACMFTARTVGMSANRLLDAPLDAKNPRTRRRAIPSGALSVGFYAAVTLLCALGFFAATAVFKVQYHNPWPLRLAAPVLLFLAAYPLLKRFTRLCHYYLGAALGLAPICAWVAISGSIAWTPIWIAGAVLCWTAGFDIIYACQDYDSDIACGVFSIPARIGIGPALWVSRATHGTSAILLLAVGFSTPLLGGLYLAGVGLAIALLIVEHALVRADDLSRVGLAFFTVNGIISIILGSLGILDVILR